MGTVEESTVAKHNVAEHNFAEHNVAEHYERLLAEHYTWMAGGSTRQVADNRQFFQAAGIAPRRGGKALDLGCGSGFQSLALAELGFDVVAVDANASLLAELRAGAAGRRVTAIQGDMRAPQVYESLGPYEVAVCMGDSLVDLQSFDEVAACLAGVRRCVEPGGCWIAAFRDLTWELAGIERALPVRLDDDRLMATFLEYEPEHVVVNDLLFVRDGGPWEMRKSAYRKLRLAPTRFARLLADLGFRNIQQNLERGWSTTIAKV